VIRSKNPPRPQQRRGIASRGDKLLPVALLLRREPLLPFVQALPGMGGSRRESPPSTLAKTLSASSNSCSEPVS
jgi:hypothetical protein